jgi:MoaA/NifB/PqqE/SkfB family radical SAM enzyme
MPCPICKQGTVKSYVIGENMKLENIGFYTLSNHRAKNVTWNSDMWRCELILTDRCNFKCAYCRGIQKEFQGDMTLAQAKEVVDIWTSGNLHNIRFSGGEPTIWKDLISLVEYTKLKPSIEHIALSTNGSATLEFYTQLCKAGVNDFSISLDACCAMTADKMAGTNARFDHISQVIKELSKMTYVTVGVVLDDRNDGELKKIIDYATGLGVSDIRIIPSAQSNHFLNIDIETNYPILKYRINNIKNGRHIRGIENHNCSECHLVKDDMVILHGKHFPCIIYMREQGEALGDVYGKTLKEIKAEREAWFDKTNIKENPICKKNCLDVCIDHNDKVNQFSMMHLIGSLYD